MSQKSPSAAAAAKDDFGEIMRHEIAIAKPPMRCGLCCWRPDFLQIGYNWKLGLVLMCWFAFLHGLLSNGLNGVNSTSLEQRFNVGSGNIGWFVAANKFSLASTTIISAYYADRTHKPRILAVAAATYSLGSLLLALPHFIMEPYKSNSQEMPAMCFKALANTSSSNSSAPDNCSWLTMSPSVYFNILIAGNVVLGIGGGIIFTVGIAFIDDFSTRAASSFNVGVAYLCNAMGTAAGFGLGSLMLTLDVNFNNKQKSNDDTTADPSFVGAWWLGYAICSGLFATVVLGFACFDRELPETAKLRPEKIAHAQTHVSSIDVDVEGRFAGRNRFCRIFAQFIDNIVRLLTNPVVVCLTIAAVLNALVTDGLQPFLVKLLRTQFGMNEISAGLAIAVLIVVGIALGSFLSGLMAQRLDMSVRSLLLVTVAFTCFCLVLSFTQTINCPKQKLAGVTVDYGSTYFPSGTRFNRSNLISECNSDCQCDPRFYEPVCSPQIGVEYYSACYAGCQRFEAKNSQLLPFSECSCLMDEFFEKNVTSVRFGTCDTSCPSMYIALVGLFLVLFSGFFIVVPLTEVMMRVVPLEERSFALSFNQALAGYLGSIPGPLMMGTIFDQSCTLHQPQIDDCSHNATTTIDDADNKNGACVVYDSDALSWWFAGILLGLSLLTIIAYLVAFVMYQPPCGETLHGYFRSLHHWWSRTLCRHRRRRSKLTSSTGQIIMPPFADFNTNTSKSHRQSTSQSQERF